jgi:hypothetical protein
VSNVFYYWTEEQQSVLTMSCYSFIKIILKNSAILIRVQNVQNKEEKQTKIAADKQGRFAAPYT